MQNKFVAKQPKQADVSHLSLEYIRGLVAGEGCFSFHTAPSAKEPGRKIRIPVFVISMSQQDNDLILLLKESMGLKGGLYSYGPRKNKKDNYNRQGMTTLMVRDLGQLKNIIVPLFHRKLIGYKAKQFSDWIEKIGSDPAVPGRYKLIHKLYTSGFYDKNPDFLEKMLPGALKSVHFSK